MDLHKILDDPDDAASDAYRAIYQQLVSQENPDYDSSREICDQFITWAQEARRQLNIAQRDAVRAAVQSLQKS